MAKHLPHLSSQPIYVNQHSSTQPPMPHKFCKFNKFTFSYWCIGKIFLLISYTRFFLQKKKTLKNQIQIMYTETFFINIF